LQVWRGGDDNKAKIQQSQEIISIADPEPLQLDFVIPDCPLSHASATPALKLRKELDVGCAGTLPAQQMRSARR
jgi:hypothetical protein